MPRYQVLIHQEAYERSASYLTTLVEGRSTAGEHLGRQLEDRDWSQLTVIEFIELLINTKRPQIFAETAVYGDGRDWNQTELSLLGDIGIAVPVTVFDNGKHNYPHVHAEPFEATLLYIAGALLRNDRGNTAVDWQEVTQNSSLNPVGYYGLYERRLLPSFIYANDVAKSKNKYAFITIPGIGCGQFAGHFQGLLEEELRKALIQFLNNYSDRFSHIRAVYYDPYKKCDNKRLEINGVSFFVRPLKKGNENKPQLCRPQQYEEMGDDFSDCHLFSFVAWDHVSFPGNDFWIGSRITDDGVKAAATSSMAIMTGIKGSYNNRSNTYDPPPEFTNWDDVVNKRNLKLQVVENLSIARP